MADKVAFPHLSGLNWPSYILEVWLRLRILGVPEHNIRFLPEPGHFAIPEVTVEWPAEPEYDLAKRRATATHVDPETIRPRLKVNVRTETVTHFDDHGQSRDEVIGRLAHFYEPMQATLSGVENTASGDSEKPAVRLTRELCETYPELVATISPALRDVLMKISEDIGIALGAPGEEARRDAAREAIEAFYTQAELRSDTWRPAPGVDLLAARQPADPQACDDAFRAMAGKLLFFKDALDGDIPPEALRQFREWADVLFEPGAAFRERKMGSFLADITDDTVKYQRALFGMLQKALDFESHDERRKVVREMVEIMTTNAFMSVAAVDYLWGIGWVHGRRTDICLDPDEDIGRNPDRPDLLLSSTGGQDPRALMARLMQRWAEQGEFLGVGPNELAPFEEVEIFELWALAAWRREAADPLVVLQQAVRRLIHPDVLVRSKDYVPAPGRFDSLFAQPGATAVLGGASVLHFPGVEILMPFAEDDDDGAVRAKAKLQALMRLFLPVCFRVEIVWRETLANLVHGTFLRHDFQQGVRLADSWTAAEREGKEETYDPVTL